ncbi:hypothetical protein FOMPIDRAFT_92229 [Fomitopsis schrenkii]|uniref:Uncharacterized protein n=1 Tax=Fomitopsis schrenkii TaxID=2126942 RepID=S8DNF2_FOMSC|nr:hypothetical protein FOMPIDRAFT_92229 [Fomitopsis schrenkii]
MMRSHIEGSLKHDLSFPKFQSSIEITISVALENLLAKHRNRLLQAQGCPVPALELGPHHADDSRYVNQQD